MQLSTNENYALAYANMGLAVHPIKAGGKTPLVSQWQDKASSDSKVIARWWSKWPDANIAIHAGKSGLIILDIDPRNGGFESLDILKEELGATWLSRYQVESGGGGLHYYYSAIGQKDLRGLNLGRGIDLIRGNKYVIAPPSIHPSGGVYKWLL